MTLNEIYKKSLNEKRLIRLKTKHPDGDNYDGIILKETDKLIFLASETDFEFNGIIIFAKKFIKGFRYGRFEECHNELIRFNGQINKVRLPVWLKTVNSWEDILRGLNKRDIWPCVEILYNKLEKSVFYIGPGIGGDEEGFTLHGYDADGKWEKEYYLNYDEIFRVEFNDKYSKNFNSYMKSKEKGS